MTASTLDVLVFLPLVPAVPVLLTSFLPWEQWLWNQIPKRILGPYLLYATFAAAYFKLDWWFVAILAVAGVVVCIFGWFEFDTDSDPKPS
jgi:hypothetical protein